MFTRKIRPALVMLLSLVTVSTLVAVAACSPAATETPPIATPPISTAPTTTPPAATTPTSGWGIIEIRGTDPGPANVKSAVVYLSNLEVHRVSPSATDNTSDNASDWVPIIEAPASFDLMNVIGVEQILGSANITAGSFTQIRMDVSKVTGVTTDNVSYTAEVPSDKLKIVGAFNVGGGNKTTLTLDFDGEKSLIMTGQGKFLFKPVVKLLVNSGGQTTQGQGGVSNKGQSGQNEGKGNSGKKD